MANKWQLNASKQIVYFDANGNKRFAKEVWYIGQYGKKYQVWPGSIYLTNVKIVDNKSHEEYDYEIDTFDEVYQLLEKSILKRRHQ